MKRRLLTLVEYIIYLIYKISYAIFCRVERKSSNNYIVLEIYCSIYKSTRAICRRMAEKHTELCNKIMHEYEKYENKKSEV